MENTLTSVSRKGQIQACLRQHWGYDSFLPLQEETVLSILKGEDSLTVLPTGGGKSLCFQLPALLMDGMAVVISPLISLMKDQVDDLKAIGIKAAYLNSSISFEMQRMVIEQIRNSEIKLLYIAPERLQGEKTLDLLKGIKISFFVIDEAHCISHWGHDFRADYRNLRVIKREFRSVGVHGFTATATREVQGDVLEQLGLSRPRIYVGRVDRPNLTYRVMARRQIFKQITGLLERHPNEAGIIYCLRRKDVDHLSSELNEAGFNNLPYHAGMTDRERHINQEKFAREEVGIIVATVAFGMGIDRSNIRFVIHSGMPKSIEHYQQETGRAGRDGLPAFCYMFYSGSDYRLWSFFASESSGRETMMKKLSAIYRFCTRPQCRHSVLSNYFGQEYPKTSCGGCDYCLNELDLVEDALGCGQKVLSSVAAVKERYYGFGASHIVNILKGKLTEKIEKRGHQNLSSFGIMAGAPEVFIRHMIEQLIGQGFLEKEEEYATLSVTDSGRRLLSGELSPVLVKPLVAAKKKDIARKTREIREEEWKEIDPGLFQALREKRAELAHEKEVPAYIIFGDRALKDMAAKKPLTKEAFSNIFGVGESKLKSYADIFIRTIKNHLVAG